MDVTPAPRCEQLDDLVADLISDIDSNASETGSVSFDELCAGGMSSIPRAGVHGAAVPTAHVVPRASLPVGKPELTRSSPTRSDARSQVRMARVRAQEAQEEQEGASTARAADAVQEPPRHRAQAAGLLASRLAAA